MFSMNSAWITWQEYLWFQKKGLNVPPACVRDQNGITVAIKMYHGGGDFKLSPIPAPCDLLDSLNSLNSQSSMKPLLPWRQTPWIHDTPPDADPLVMWPSVMQ